MNELLSVRGLTKNFDRFSLQELSFSLPEGCITGFIGANGAGKTTTLRTILDLIHKDSGDVRIFGLDMSTDARAIKDRIGVVLDDGGFYDELSLGEMKRIIAPAYSRWSDEDFQRWLDHFRLDPHQKIATLSRGMRMKFALALAMSHGAELLIMDEPTSGLDPKIRRQLLRTLSTFMENGGKGVFFSTHITSDLDKIADFLVMIDDGQILFQEDKDTLLDSHRILKGDSASLTADTRPLFLSLEETAYGFTGLTRAPEALDAFPDALVERPTVEDIMLAYMKGDARHAHSSRVQRFSHR